MALSLSTTSATSSPMYLDNNIGPTSSYIYSSSSSTILRSMERVDVPQGGSDSNRVPYLAFFGQYDADATGQPDISTLQFSNLATNQVCDPTCFNALGLSTLKCRLFTNRFLVPSLNPNPDLHSLGILHLRSSERPIFGLSGGPDRFSQCCSTTEELLRTLDHQRAVQRDPGQRPSLWTYRGIIDHCDWRLAHRWSRRSHETAL